MSERLRIILFILVIATDLYTVMQIRHGKMSLNHSLLWILVSLVLLAGAVFPGLFGWISAKIGIELPINMVFLLFALFSVLFFVYLTKEISREDWVNRRLTQQVAILEKKVGELEEALRKGSGAEHAGERSETDVQ